MLIGEKNGPAGEDRDRNSSVVVADPELEIAFQIGTCVLFE